MGSTTVLEKIGSLCVGKFDYQREPKLIKEEESKEIEHDPKKIIRQKLHNA
jgi:hypothetical protein